MLIKIRNIVVIGTLMGTSMALFEIFVLHQH